MNTERLELKQGKEYIVAKYLLKGGYANNPFKIKVLEVTETTYVIVNLDLNTSKERLFKEAFNDGYKVLEELGIVDLTKTYTLHEQLEKIKALRDQLEKSSITKVITNDLINRQRFCDFGGYVTII